MNWPWGERREGEATAVYLGRVLEDYAGMPLLATKALAFHYDDYFCPPEIDDGMNLHRLIADLQNAMRRAPQVTRVRAKEIERAAKEGEFDGTREEADAWGESPEGQAVMRELMRGH